MMSDQLTIEEAIEAGQAGAAQAADTSGDEWVTYATGFVYTYLEQHDTLFVDDLWAAGLIEPVSPRALGAVLGRAARDGWMEPITTDDGYLACRRSVRSHMTPKIVWRSLLR